jgi:hypothetical protein
MYTGTKVGVKIPRSPLCISTLFLDHVTLCNVAISNASTSGMGGKRESSLWADVLAFWPEPTERPSNSEEVALSMNSSFT